MMPSSVQTGCSKGWSESEQQSKGNRRKIWLFLRPPAPPKIIPPSENSLLHSEWVMYILSTGKKRRTKRMSFAETTVFVHVFLLHVCYEHGWCPCLFPFPWCPCPCCCRVVLVAEWRSGEWECDGGGSVTLWENKKIKKTRPWLLNPDVVRMAKHVQHRQ